MAITVVQSGQTLGSGNNLTITITAATAGNTLVSFFSQSLATTPTCATGFTVNATKAVYNTSADSTWVAYKIATGGETSVTWTAGAGGTGHGLCVWELAGANAAITLDGTPVSTDNISGVTGGRAYTTSVAGSIVLIGNGGNVSTGTITAWTGTNVATNIGTAAARCFGGSFITTGTVSSTFTSNWTTSGVRGMLAIALQPPAADGTQALSLLTMGVGS